MNIRQITELLGRIEPSTPPSRRFNRIVTVGGARVLEMRDPNSGQRGGPEDKPRHQYMLAGGALWTRRLPPEAVGDAWRDIGIPQWQPMAEPGPLLRDFAALADDHKIAVVRRLALYSSDDEIEFYVAGKYVYAEGRDVEIVAGPILTSWWDVPLPPCPDCGGDLVWYEAGYVPGARKCLGQPTEIVDDDSYPDGKGRTYDVNGGCGSMFTVDSR